MYFIFKKLYRPSRVAELVGASSYAPKVCSLIPSQGKYLACGFIPSHQGEYERHIIMFLSHIDIPLSLSLFLSLKHILGED